MARQRSASGRRARIGLALAGGGPLGAIYEIGALCALQDSLRGVELTGLDHYVGVSAGSFIAAGLAQGMTPRRLCATFIDRGGADDVSEFDPAWLMVPAYREYGRRLLRLPRLLAEAAWQVSAGRQPFTQALETLGAALPTGLFSNQVIHEELARLFAREGLSNDFRELRTRLTLVATDLDSGDAAPFGQPGWEHVPISRAVQASAALPGLFPPVQIDGRCYVDGALKKTMHASVALDGGVDLLLCLNPLVPFNAAAAPEPRVMQRGLRPEQRRIPRIVDGGLPSVLSQTFRSMIHSRMELGMKHYERSYPGTDIVLIEPDHRDPRLYLANTFSYAQRRQLAEHAYQQTRRLLRAQAGDWGPRLARHGVELDHAALRDPRAVLCMPAAERLRLAPALALLQELLEDVARLRPAPGIRS